MLDIEEKQKIEKLILYHRDVALLCELRRIVTTQTLEELTIKYLKQLLEAK
jgi:hypothetical protein